MKNIKSVLWDIFWILLLCYSCLPHHFSYTADGVRYEYNWEDKKDDKTSIHGGTGGLDMPPDRRVVSGMEESHPSP